MPVKHDLKDCLTDLAAGRGPRVLLVFGDDFQVAESCRAVLDQLVPAEQRAFNLERFDGASASWEQIEASLMTPPFFAGKKVLWVDSVPYFYAREQSGELGEKVLDLWREGKKDNAAKLLVDLLMVEGWSQEQWDGLDNVSFSTLLNLLGATDDGQDETRALLAYCKTRPIELTRRKGGEGNRLGALLNEGLPEWSFLLMTALQVDRRTRLFKRMEELGAVLHLALERERNGKISRESLAQFLGKRVRQAGKNLDPQAREMILAKAGDDLRGLQQELDKLFLFVGERATVRAEDVALMVTDRGEGWIFDLTRALGERDAAEAISHLARLIAQGEPPLKILGTVAAEVRRLLFARQILASESGKSWRRGMTYAQFQQTMMKQGSSPLGRNPYADYMCFQRAERFSLHELSGLMQRLFETDLLLKSNSEPRLVLEKLFLDACLRRQRRSARRESIGA